MKIYLLDDELPAIERLSYLITNHIKNNITIVGSSTNPDKAFEEILNLKPDLLFLDVEMPSISGLNFANKLSTNGFYGKVVFVTAYSQYSIKAIRENAFDYLLKPIDVDELSNCFERYNIESENQISKEVLNNFQITEREMEIIKLLSEGLSSEDISTKIHLSRHTVDTHRRNIHLKTGTRNTVELLNLLKFY